MRTLINDPPPMVQTWLEQRQSLGQDRYDEVWAGVHHVAPLTDAAHGDLDEQLIHLLTPAAQSAGLRGSGPFNLGEPSDYRVPDRAYLRDRAATTFVATAAIVVEIVSPNDETWHKLDFYFAHGVDELLVIDPHAHSVEWLARGDQTYERTTASGLLGISAHDLHKAIDWPPVD